MSGKRTSYNTTTTALDRPPDGFCEWWNPTGEDALSDASIGGHIDAERTWVRKEPGRYVRRIYGFNAVAAWMVQRYRDQYNAWREAGCPASTPWASTALPVAEQTARWREIMLKLKNLDRPTQPQIMDYDPSFQPIDF